MSLRYGKCDSLDLELILLGALIARPEWSANVNASWFINERTLGAFLDVQAEKQRAQKSGGLESLLRACGCEGETKDCKSAMKSIVERVKLYSADWRIRKLAFEYLGTPGEQDLASNDKRREFIKAVSEVVDELSNGNGKQ